MSLLLSDGRQVEESGCLKYWTPIWTHTHAHKGGCLGVGGGSGEESLNGMGGKVH